MTAGDLLRAGREALGLTQQQAARQLLCQVPLLAALEAGETPAMAPVYVSGFLTRYLDMLDLADEERLQVKAYFCSAEEAEVRSIFPDSHRRPGADRWIRLSSYILGALLVGTLIWQMSQEWGRQADTGFSRVAPVTDDSLARSVGKPIRETAAGAGPGLAAPATQVSDAVTSVPTGGEQLSAGDFTLVLEASADSWVEISGAEGMILEQDLLRGGDRRSYENDGPFMMSVGRASAVRITLNDFPIDLNPHTQDDVARLWLRPAEILPAPDLAGPATVTSTFSD